MEFKYCGSCNPGSQNETGHPIILRLSVGAPTVPFRCGIIQSKWIRKSRIRVLSALNRYRRSKQMKSYESGSLFGDMDRVPVHRHNRTASSQHPPNKAAASTREPYRTCLRNYEGRRPKARTNGGCVHPLLVRCDKRRQSGGCWGYRLASLCGSTE